MQGDGYGYVVSEHFSKIKIHKKLLRLENFEVEKSYVKKELSFNCDMVMWYNLSHFMVIRDKIYGNRAC